MSGGAVAKAFWIGVTNLRRTLRARSNLFFVFVFPMLMILVIGASFGGSVNPKLGVVVGRPGALSTALLRQFQHAPGLSIVRVANASALLTMVERGGLAAGVEIPAGYDSAISSGRTATLSYVARPGLSSAQLGEAVRSVAGAQSALLGAARFAIAEHAAPDFGAAIAQARRVAPAVPAISVRQRTAGTSLFPPSLGQFEVGAWTELLLFLFLTAMTGAIALIEIRRLGIPRRMLATPTSAGVVIAGETFGRVLVGLVQAAVIIFGSALLFAVHWGQPLGVAAIVILFDLVGAGFGVLMGTLFRNEQQAMGVSLLLGLGLAALGGCMVPLEFFSPTMKRVAHLTPHAWANEAFTKLIGHNASISGIAPQLGVLAAYAAVLLALATWRLRRVLVATIA